MPRACKQWLGATWCQRVKGGRAAAAPPLRCGGGTARISCGRLTDARCLDQPANQQQGQPVATHSWCSTLTGRVACNRTTNATTLLPPSHALCQHSIRQLWLQQVAILRRGGPGWVIQQRRVSGWGQQGGAGAKSGRMSRAEAGAWAWVRPWERRGPMAQRNRSSSELNQPEASCRRADSQGAQRGASAVRR